ncbi:hypothetical protein ACFPZI_26670 [Streptomyces chlorus]|uniref:Uncharacterized protein n=1 Tax=Streptomyces chlorus TaxID=887452 RepID=A0ABW1E4A7_9ACTN
MRIRIRSDGDKRTPTDLQAWLGQAPKARRIPVTPVSEPGPTTGALDATALAVWWLGFHGADGRAGRALAAHVSFPGRTADNARRRSPGR